MCRYILIQELSVNQCRPLLNVCGFGFRRAFTMHSYFRSTGIFVLSPPTDCIVYSKERNTTSQKMTEHIIVGIHTNHATARTAAHTKQKGFRNQWTTFCHCLLSQQEAPNTFPGNKTKEKDFLSTTEKILKNPEVREKLTREQLKFMLLLSFYPNLKGDRAEKVNLLQMLMNLRLNRLLQLRLRFWVLLRSTGSFYTWKCILSAYTAVRWSPETGEMDSRGKREVEKSTSNQPSKVVVLCHGADLGGLCGT
ncbi:hypothetical protein AV530_007510 [Patagioenas fasciata monilis]|uniref:Uncharacterized protein n=1 Tax=Patagioenas fasciata monilis TaxID=372326 RepID=A0A1V4JY02_PATFA|nr:hypothetical protein AV530_007510 [Patagioenas fasciata monilis]